MIQHYRYSESAMNWVCLNLRAVLDGKKTIQEVREANPKNLKISRDERIMRTKGDPPPRKFNWEMTIADVAGKYDDATGYRGLIRCWTETTLRQMGY